MFKPKIMKNKSKNKAQNVNDGKFSSEEPSASAKPTRKKEIVVIPKENAVTLPMRSKNSFRDEEAKVERPKAFSLKKENTATRHLHCHMKRYEKLLKKHKKINDDIFAVPMHLVVSVENVESEGQKRFKVYKYVSWVVMGVVLFLFVVLNVIAYSVFFHS